MTLRMATVTVAMLLAALAIALSVGPRELRAQPETYFSFPEDGAELSEPPPVLRMCFTSSVSVENSEDDGYEFSLLTPDERRLGMRIVFQTNGLGVDIYPGIPDQGTEGAWTFEWRVTDRETGEPSEGVTRFSVGPGGTAPPESFSGRCTGESDQQSDGASGESDDDGGNTSLLVFAIIVAVAVLVIVFAVIYRRRSSTS